MNTPAPTQHAMAAIVDRLRLGPASFGELRDVVVGVPGVPLNKVREYTGAALILLDRRQQAQYDSTIHKWRTAP